MKTSIAALLGILSSSAQAENVFTPSNLTGTWWSNATDVPSNMLNKVVCPPWEPSSMTQQVNRVDMTTDEIGASKVRVCFWSNPDAALANPDEPGLCEVYAGLFEFESGVFEGYCEPSKANPLDLKQLKMKVSPDTLDTVFDEMGKVQKSDKIGLLVKRSRVFKVSDSPSSELPSWEDLAILAPPTTSSASAKKMMRSTLLTAATAIVVGFIVL